MLQFIYIIRPCIFDPTQSDSIQLKTLIKTNEISDKNLTKLNLTQLDFQQCVFMTNLNIHGLKYTWAVTYILCNVRVIAFHMKNAKILRFLRYLNTI